MKPQSPVLLNIGLSLLKFVSSHRGLTYVLNLTPLDHPIETTNIGFSPELFDEYTRRQYVAKAPARNPFGTDEVPVDFKELDIFTKVRGVLT